MTPMTCRNCGAGLAPDAAGRRDDLVVCQHCGSVHERARLGPAAATGTAVPPRRIGLPSRFEVHRTDGALRVSWRKGRRSGALALGFFSLAWLAIGLMSGVWPMLLMVPLLGYYALVRGLNRVSFDVGASGLRVQQGPLPWPGAKRLERAEIEQLFSIEKLTKVRTGSDGRERTETRRHYRLRARRADGHSVDVISGLDSADQALWLEREAEQVLGLDDAAVAGEVRR